MRALKVLPLYLSPALGVGYALQSIPITVDPSGVSALAAEILKGGAWAAFSLYMLWMWRADTAKHAAQLERLNKQSLDVVAANTAQLSALQGTKACIYSRHEAEEIAAEIDRRERRE